MSYSDVLINEVLSKIYFDISNSGSFGGVNSLYNVSQKILPSIKKQTVINWLKNVNSYTLHKPVINNFVRNKYLLQRINEQWECDLVDMQTFSKFNKGYKYIITIIDCFSKYLYALPLKNKTNSSIINVFKIIFEKVKPEKLRSDKGLEFNNKFFKKFLNENDVNYFTSNDSKIKCAIVERVNRTIKSRMFRYFTHYGTRKYIDILPNLVKSYNDSYHRTIKMKPNEVNISNQKFVFNNVYKSNNFKKIILKNINDKKINMNDNVRIKYDLNKQFDKSYYPLWSDRVYKIGSVKNTPIKTYKIVSEQNEIDKVFYKQDLQTISKFPEFRIEKILNKRKRNGNEEIFVKWLGYPESYNQWIQKKNINRLKTKAGLMIAPLQPQRK